MRIPRLLLVVILLVTSVTSGCEDASGHRKAELMALRDSMHHLNALEDRAFVLIQVDSNAGRLVADGSGQDLQRVVNEARDARMTGCASVARSVLVTALEEIIGGTVDAWPLVARYRDVAESCDAALEDSLRPGSGNSK